MTTHKKLNQAKKLIICFLTLFLTFLPTVGWANTESELNFYITPVLPESQLDNGASGYFDLNLAPGSSDTLGLEIQNNSDQAIDVQVSAHTAFTNVNGVVEYGKDAEEADPTLPFELSELIESPDMITLDANESKTVEVPIRMPEEAFEGVLAGGIRVEEVKEEREQEQEGAGLAIKNAFSYVVGVVVSNNRSATEPGLDLLDVFADQVNYRNVFSAQIQNYTPTFVNQMAVQATIREEGEDEVLYETNREGLQMAPNSNFNFPISLNGDAFKSGTYVLNMTARSEGEEWSWEKTFTIESETARRLNQEDVTIDNGINWWMIATIGILLVLLAVIGYLIYKNKKQVVAEEQDTNENNN
ncbi:MAG: DUF916 and DUF3324 domain-containing protein [Enterococcus casseliflavus]|nr:DUF916 and DUF3324 domain-containing protein [Enterococcus casseliflavus]